MNVTKTVVRVLNMNSSLKGFATVTLSDGQDSLVIDGFKIMEKKDGTSKFVSCPSTSFKNKEGQTEYKDTVFPVNAELRDKINLAILEVYNYKVNKGTPTEAASPVSASNANRDASFQDDVDLPF